MSSASEPASPAPPLHCVWKGSALSHAKWCAWIACTIALVLQTSIIEDAFIPLRVVGQFWEGNGLVWNLGERVQVSTSLPWQLLLLPFAWPDPLRGLVVLCWLLSSSAVALTIKSCRSPRTLSLVTACWLASFILPSYMVCGLETPLAMLVLVAVATARKRDCKWWALAAGALPAIRHDLVLLAVPQIAVTVRSWRGRERNVGLVLLLAPLALVSVFCFFYFGSVLPNTAFAKMSACLPSGEVAEKGWTYLLCSYRMDPLLWVIPALALWVGSRSAPSEALALAVGWLLTVLYVWLAAADYMSGRFLLPPVALGIGLLSKSELTKSECAAALAVIAAGWLVQDRSVLCAAAPPAPTPGFRVQCIHEPSKGIFVPLGRLWRPDPLEGIDLARIGRNLPEYEMSGQGSIGIMGYCSPSTHRIRDFLALADPLTARPPSPWDPMWRPGHYLRIQPAGVELWEKTGNVGAISDPEVARLAELVRAAAYSPDLWSWSRFWKIVQLHLWKPSPMLRFKMIYPNAKWKKWGGPVQSVVVKNTHGVTVPVAAGEKLVVESTQPFEATAIAQEREKASTRVFPPTCDTPAKIVPLEKTQSSETGLLHIKPLPGSRLPLVVRLFRSTGRPISVPIEDPPFTREQMGWDCSRRHSPVPPGNKARCVWGKRLEGTYVVRLHPPIGYFLGRTAGLCRPACC